MIFFVVPQAQLSRPPLARMLRIHDELRRGAHINCTKLGKELEVSRKTILRDIAFMRDRLDLPIEFDAHIQAYRYTETVTAFPTVNVTEPAPHALPLWSNVTGELLVSSKEKAPWNGSGMVKIAAPLSALALAAGQAFWGSSRR